MNVVCRHSKEKLVAVQMYWPSDFLIGCLLPDSWKVVLRITYPRDILVSHCKSVLYVPLPTELKKHSTYIQLLRPTIATRRTDQGRWISLKLTPIISLKILTSAARVPFEFAFRAFTHINTAYLMDCTDLKATLCHTHVDGPQFPEMVKTTTFLARNELYETSSHLYFRLLLKPGRRKSFPQMSRLNGRTCQSAKEHPT